MATNKTFNVAGAARSPPSEFSLQAQGRNFPTSGLTSDEAKLLEQQINSLINPFDTSGIGALLRQRSNTIAHAAAFAKAEFDGKLFGGMNAGDNEIGFDVLRPGHIRADPADGAPQNDWYYTPAAAGWNDWIGDGGGNNFQANSDQVVLILGMVDQDSSTELTGVNVEEFGRNVDMLPKDLSALKLRDNENELQAVAFPSLMLQENEEAHVRLRYDRVVESQPRLLGFTFGLGTYMNSEDY